uniref:Uncharacterized protein n=1 Tax=Oryza nivara TaxID=4536 RepID=A0A0E0HZ77_ORYNI
MEFLNLQNFGNFGHYRNVEAKEVLVVQHVAGASSSKRTRKRMLQELKASHGIPMHWEPRRFTNGNTTMTDQANYMSYLLVVYAFHFSSTLEVEMPSGNVAASVPTMKILVLQSTGPNLAAVVHLRYFPCLEKLYVRMTL